MHDIDDDHKPRTLKASTDPLRGAPPPGLWAIWHGPQAQAALRVAAELGRPATAAERDVTVPADLSQPQEAGAPAWVLEQGERRWLLRRDAIGDYVSAYLLGLGAG